jgi:hypothetical protein
MTTTLNTCTYIGTGTPCTSPALEGRSYCADHYAVVYKVGSGKQRKKDTAKAQRVRYVQQLFYEACEQLEAEGFDVYGDSEMDLAPAAEEFDDR